MILLLFSRKCWVLLEVSCIGCLLLVVIFSSELNWLGLVLDRVLELNRLLGCNW